jgi:hypothetical protein
MKSAGALDLTTMLPLMAAEHPQRDIGRPFQVHSGFEPAGDHSQAIEELCEGVRGSERDQVLLGGHQAVVLDRPLRICRVQ